MACIVSALVGPSAALIADAPNFAFNTLDATLEPACAPLTTFNGLRKNNGASTAISPTSLPGSFCALQPTSPKNSSAVCLPVNVS